MVKSTPVGRDSELWVRGVKKVNSMKDKYVRFNSEHPHYQIDKFNGTKGYVNMTPDMVGTLNPEKGTYVFDEVNGVIPEFIAGLLTNIRSCGKTIFMDSVLSDKYHDEDDLRLKERFEKRLFTAKSQLDISIAERYYVAGQIDRLSIKETMLRWEQDPIN